MSSREERRREHRQPRPRARDGAGPRRAERGRSLERGAPRGRWPRGEDAAAAVAAWPGGRNSSGAAYHSGERRWGASGEQSVWAQNRDRDGTAWRGPPSRRNAPHAGSTRQNGGPYAGHRPDGDGDVAPKRRRSRFSPVRVSRDRWEPSLFDRYSPVQDGRSSGGAARYGHREAETNGRRYHGSRQRSPEQARAPRRRQSRSRDRRRRFESTRERPRRSDHGRRPRSSRRRPGRRSGRRPRRYSSRSRSPRHRSPSSSGSGDSDDSGTSSREESSHLFVEPGDWVGAHYQVTRFAGKGTFGRVYLCRDTRCGREAAVKALRAVRRYTEQAEIEADILEDIARRDPGSNSRMVRLLDRFKHGDHACLAFEPLSSSLYDVMKHREFRPLAASTVRLISAQLLHAVAFMHAMHLTHTDLKLENVMLTRGRPAEADGHEEEEEGGSSSGVDRDVDMGSRDVRVIDFGSATYASQHHSSVINTRQYRSPEVILGQGWDESSDVWSCACIILELLHGKLLFSTHDNEEHLALMERTLGPFPRAMVRRARKRSETRYWFDDRDHVTHLSGRTASGKRVDRESEQHVNQQRRLEDLVGGDHTMLDALRGMLEQDPRRRLTARQALQHAWLREFAPPWVDPAPAPASA